MVWFRVGDWLHTYYRQPLPCISMTIAAVALNCLWHGQMPRWCCVCVCLLTCKWICVWLLIFGETWPRPGAGFSLRFWFACWSFIWPPVAYSRSSHHSTFNFSVYFLCSAPHAFLKMLNHYSELSKVGSVFWFFYRSCLFPSSFTSLESSTSYTVGHLIVFHVHPSFTGIS